MLGRIINDKKDYLFVIVLGYLLVVSLMEKVMEPTLRIWRVSYSWEVTDKGLKDGSERTVYVFCLSDMIFDGKGILAPLYCFTADPSLFGDDFIQRRIKTW